MQIFKEISIGGLTKDQLIQQLIKAGVQFNDYAKILFEHPSFAPTLTTEKIKLVKIKMSDLDINGACSLQTITEQAANLSLKLCPLYLGAFLRLEYLNQPEGPYLTIASPQPETDENYPTGFYIRNLNNILWLRGYRVVGEAEWPSENEFIFRA